MLVVLCCHIIHSNFVLLQTSHFFANLLLIPLQHLIIEIHHYRILRWKAQLFYLIIVLFPCHTHSPRCYFLPSESRVSEIEVSLGDPVMLRCDARYYPGVPQYVEWYKARVTVYTKFNGHDPFIHPAFQVCLVWGERSEVCLRYVLLFMTVIPVPNQVVFTIKTLHPLLLPWEELIVKATESTQSGVWLSNLDFDMYGIVTLHFRICLPLKKINLL